MADLKGYLRRVQMENDACRCGHLRWQHEHGTALTGRLPSGERRPMRAGGCAFCECGRFRRRVLDAQGEVA